MINKELAQIFDGIANYLEIDAVSFRSKAYRKASDLLEGLGEDIEQVYIDGGKEGLEEMEGIGSAIAGKIEEYIKTGKVKMYEDLKKKTPFKLEEVIAIEGLGVKRAKELYEKLGVLNLNDLEKAAKAKKIRKLEGFGEKSEQNILEAIGFLRASNRRFEYDKIALMVKRITSHLSKLKEVKKIEVAGSFRRKKKTIGDIDILAVSSKPSVVMDRFIDMPGVIKVWGRGETKSSIRIKPGIDVDLRVVPGKSFGAALQYFTGSKEHNIAVRKVAISKGLKLNEYGLFKGGKMIAGRTEKGIYDALGLPYLDPRDRE